MCLVWCGRGLFCLRGLEVHCLGGVLTFLCCTELVGQFGVGIVRVGILHFLYGCLV